MKALQILGGACAVMVVAGCGTCPVKKSGCCANVDVAAAGTGRGYVEFSSRENNAPVPVYIKDDKQRLQLLGVIGVKAGDRYRPAPDEQNVPICETLRVAASPGVQTFMIQRDGEVKAVSVVEEKVTPVQVDYTVIDHGALNEVYRVNAYVLEPVPSSESRQGLAKH
jgi:hypothetical protein